MKFQTFIFSILFVNFLFAQPIINFEKVQDAFDFAEKNSVVIKTNNQQVLMAKWTKIAAIGNTINLKNPITLSLTDNTKLPVSFLPAESFGGTPGTFKQITLGQQYQDLFSFTPSIDLVSPATWEKIKSASINQELTLVNNQLLKKSLFESVAAAYFNSTALISQIKLLQLNLQSSDSIAAIVSKKYKAGIVRKTDENEALILTEIIKEKINQSNFLLAQQLNNLKILCDIPADTKLTITPSESDFLNTNQPPILNDLQKKQAELQYSFAKAEYASTKLNHLPTIALVSSFSWQHNSNSSLFDSSKKWIGASFVGLKFNLNLPSDFTKIAAQTSAKYTSAIAKFNLEHLKNGNDLNQKQLILENEKSSSQYQSTLRIQTLKDENFEKFTNLYKDDLISMDRLLNAYNDKISNELARENAKAILQNSNTKIFINNTIK